MDFLVLLTALLDLCKSVLDLPADWNSKEQVKEWLHGMEAGLATVIVILVPDSERVHSSRDAFFTDKFLREAEQKFRGTALGDIDWGSVVDWVAGMLKMAFPQYASIIDLAVTILKQFLVLAAEQADSVPVKSWQLAKVNLSEESVE